MNSAHTPALLYINLTPGVLDVLKLAILPVADPSSPVRNTSRILKPSLVLRSLTNS